MPRVVSMGFLDKLMGKKEQPRTGHGEGPPGSKVDPVCKMWVDPTAPPGGSSMHGTETYYFCGPSCKRAFDADPHQYLGAEHSH